MTRDNTPCEAADARECCEIGSEFGMVRSILGKDARVAKQSSQIIKHAASKSEQAKRACTQARQQAGRTSI